MEIQSNACVVAGGGSGDCVIDFDPLLESFSFTAVVTCSPTAMGAGDRTLFIAFRVDFGTNTYYFLRIVWPDGNDTSDPWELAQVVAGVQTTLANGTTGFSVSTPIAVSIVADTSSIAVDVDGDTGGALTASILVNTLMLIDWNVPASDSSVPSIDDVFVS